MTLCLDRYASLIELNGWNYRILQELPLPADHADYMCEGNCPMHPLMNDPSISYMTKALALGVSFGDLLYEELQAIAASETWEDVAARKNREAAAAAARAIAEETNKREIYARDTEIRSKMGLKRGEKAPKRLEPCKWVTGEFKGEECWAHEYVDPVTYKSAIDRGLSEAAAKKLAFTVKHTCQRIHPGEEGWCPEWLTNPRFRPNASPTENRFGVLKGRCPNAQRSKK